MPAAGMVAWEAWEISARGTLSLLLRSVSVTGGVAPR